VVTLQASTLQVSLLTAATWLPWLLIALPAGAWVDRLPRRPLMLVCDLASAALLISVPVAAWVGVLTTTQLLAVALLTGAASVLFETANQVYVPGIVATPDLAEANSTLQASQAATQVGRSGSGGSIKPDPREQVRPPPQNWGAVSGKLPARRSATGTAEPGGSPDPRLSCTGRRRRGGAGAVWPGGR